MEVSAIDPADAHHFKEFKEGTGDVARYYEVEMTIGDMFVVPKGERHRPIASNARVMLIEKTGTVKT